MLPEPPPHQTRSDGRKKPGLDRVNKVSCSEKFHTVRFRAKMVQLTFTVLLSAFLADVKLAFRIQASSEGKWTLSLARGVHAELDQSQWLNTFQANAGI